MVDDIYEHRFIRGIDFRAMHARYYKVTVPSLSSPFGSCVPSVWDDEYPFSYNEEKN